MPAAPTIPAPSAKPAAPAAGFCSAYICLHLPISLPIFCFPAKTAAPRDAASAFGERFFVGSRFGERRRTLCTSSFPNRWPGGKAPAKAAAVSRGVAVTKKQSSHRSANGDCPVAKRKEIFACALKTKERIDKRLLPCASAYIIAHRFHILNANCAAAPEETAANCKAPTPSGAPAPRSPLPKCPSCFLLFRRKGCPSPAF